MLGAAADVAALAAPSYGVPDAAASSSAAIALPATATVAAAAAEPIAAAAVSAIACFFGDRLHRRVVQLSQRNWLEPQLLR